MVRRACVVLVAVAATSAVGCVQILGLDHGTPEDSAGSPGESAPDGDAPMLDGDADRASATDGRAGDVTHASDANDSPVTSGSDGGCAYTACGDGCWDTANDPMHCGSCTRACPNGPHSQATCTAGVCGNVCDQGYVDCAGHACSCGGGMLCLSNDTCGACRAALQPCQVGSDCCSGNCGGSLTCL